ncbi:L,D-transpeptidase [Paenibacillus solisilvae]|uniref:L,D-transpeptidase n=1 Tax=Paenibacillus solisilvae TaxID=2486751 RepID=A0ABW0VZJ5_9BACL
MKQAAISMILALVVSLTFSLTAANAQPVEDDMCLVINKTRNILSVYINNEPIYSFQIATGKGELTPVGEFKIANKIVNPWYVRKNIPSGDKRNPLGTRWMGLSVPNTGGYRYGIHGTNAPYSIGRSVSSGCIRMRNKDIEWLFRHIGVGTRVIIKK